MQQLTLNFVGPSSPTPSPQTGELRDPKARAQAIEILVRLIAKAAKPRDQTETTDE